MFDIESTDRSGHMASPDRPVEGSWRHDIMNTIETPQRIIPRAAHTCDSLQSSHSQSWQTYPDCKVCPLADSPASLENPISTTSLLRRGSIRVLGSLNISIDF